MSTLAYRENFEGFDLPSEPEVWRRGTVEGRASEQQCGLDAPPLLPGSIAKGADFSDGVPAQLVAWHAFNWTGSRDSGHCGEWLRCLKATTEGDRQFIWSGSAIAGIVTFAGWVRDGGGFYEGWGGITHLPRPVCREQLLRDRRTRARFDSDGIHALQGHPIRVAPRLAEAIIDLAGGVRATEVPTDEPDYSEEPIL